MKSDRDIGRSRNARLTPRRDLLPDSINHHVLGDNSERPKQWEKHDAGQKRTLRDRHDDIVAVIEEALDPQRE